MYYLVLTHVPCVICQVLEGKFGMKMDRTHHRRELVECRSIFTLVVVNCRSFSVNRSDLEFDADAALLVPLNLANLSDRAGRCKIPLPPGTPQLTFAIFITPPLFRPPLTPTESTPRDPALRPTTLTIAPTPPLPLTP